MDSFIVFVCVLASAGLAALSADKNLSLYIVIPAVVLLWGVAVAILRHKGGAYNYMGVGTMLYGRSASANGYIATKWIVILFVPILPVAAYEVLEEGNLQDESSGMFYGSSQSIRYRMLPGFRWRQVLLTLLVGWGITAAIVYLLNRFG